MPPILATAFAAAAGACVGSFLNVLIHRLPRGRSIVRPRSACPVCGAPIAWHDNVPVLSWLLLGGRCRRCRAPISARYPLVEAATALLFGLLHAGRGATPGFALDAALGAALIALILIDAGHQLLPDALTLPGIALGILTGPLRDGGLTPPLGGIPEGTADAIAGAALGFFLPWSINLLYRGQQAARRVPAAARQDGIGRGDFKLLAMIGAFLGVRGVLLSLLLGSLAGAATGLVLIACAGYGWKSRLPYGVFLGGAAILLVLAGAAPFGPLPLLPGAPP